MRDRVGRDAVAPDDRRRGDERVDDGLLGRLDDGIEQLVDGDVADGADGIGGDADRVVVVARTGRDPIAGRERDEQVAARVAARAADPGDPEARALRQPLALVGEQRRVRGDDDDDRS